MSLYCKQETRRDAVRRRRGRNGLDYVEVMQCDPPELHVYFLGKLPPEFQGDASRMVEHVRIEGGLRITDLKVTGVDPVADPDPEKDDFLVVRLDRRGDMSPYTLRLAGVENLDPCYDRARFSFACDCPADADCAQARIQGPPAVSGPEIDYLAKDYDGFRQLILDRLSLLMPDWKERHAPDLGIALVELLAYAGDALSYFQDAVATEAYLDTARQRISVRRHALLVDYRLHEGCNARAWVCVGVSEDLALAAGDVAFITRLTEGPAPRPAVLHWDDLADVPLQEYEVFEPLSAPRTGTIQLRKHHGEIRFHTWGNRECCLRQGSTSATLQDGWIGPAPGKAPGAGESAPAKRLPKGPPARPAPRERMLHLEAGDVLIFEETVGPRTGNPADADPSRRHAVRLTKVTPGLDTLCDQPIVEIEWGPQDATPVPLCLSTIGPAPECQYLDGVTVARGNVILADHGRTTGPEALGEVPAVRTEATCECVGHPGETRTFPGLFRPSLAKGPLTFRAPLPCGRPGRRPFPAASMLTQDVRAALPQVWLESAPAGSWEPRHDLIGSLPGDRHFVVEVDNDGVAHLRFGDGELGLAPAAGTSFRATFRVGNGASGNVGAETICHLVLKGKATLRGVSIEVRNPLPARGGTEAEPAPQAKLLAPHAFRKRIERAITAADYACLAGRRMELQKASAALVWTGSWYEAVVAIDPKGMEGAAPSLLDEIGGFLHPYRRMGHDLRVLCARYVPLDLALKICVKPDFLRDDVQAALLGVLGNRVLPCGPRGFFHPDNLTFGQEVGLSKIVAAAQAVPGVQSVQALRFHRLYESPNHELESGVLPLGTDEIAQLDNDPNNPEHGRLEVQMCGGR